MTIPRGGLGTTGLGAVGGPRGTAAGALRIIIEFLTTYDPKAIKSVKNDIAGLDAQAAAIARTQASRQRSASTLAQKIAQTEAVIASKFTRQQKAELRTIGALRETGSARDLTLARQRQNILVQSIATNTKFTAEQAKAITNRFRDLNRQKKLAGEITELDRQQAVLADKKADSTKRLTGLEQVRAQLPSRLGGLAIGALGGIVGGALFGVGFQLADQALQQLGSRLHDLLDPGRHARQIMLDVGEAVNKLARTETITTLEAVRKILEDIGIAGDETLERLLTQAAEQQGVSAALSEQLKLQQAIEQSTALELQNREEARKLLIERGEIHLPGASGASGGLFETAQAFAKTLGLVKKDLEDELTITQFLASLARNIASSTQARAQAAALAAQAAEREATALRRHEAFSTITRQIGTTALTGGFEGIIGGLRDQQAALGAGGGGGGGGPSAAIRAEQEAQEDLRFERARAEIQEQRQLLLLKERLELLGQNFNLEQFQGKFLLVAIEARIDALNKEGDAIKRRNALIDIQRAQDDADKLRRSEGEAIGDFIERRAEANEQVLRDRDEMARQDKIDTLEALRDRTQAELDLAQNAEDMKLLLEQRASDLRMRALQKEADAASAIAGGGVDARVKKLEEEIKAWEKKRDLVLKYSDEEYLGTLNNAVLASTSIQKLARIFGEIQGLTQARGYIDALVKGGILTAAEAAGKLAVIDAALGNFKAQQKAVIPDFGDINARNVRSTPRGNARGGVFPLNNGSTIFGQNVRSGEEGSELGVILSNRVVQALRESEGSTVNFNGGMTINTYRNPYADAYRIKKAVRQEFLRKTG